MRPFDDRTRELLYSVPLFEALSGREVDSILGAAKDLSFDEGKQIVEQGESGVGFHLILEGTCRVLVDDDEVATLGSGDYFGEMSLVDGGPRSATVVADTPVRTLSLTSWTFLPLLEQNPAIARKLLVVLSRRLRASERSLKH